MNVSNCRLCGARLERRPDDRLLYDPALSRCSRCETVQLNFQWQGQEDLYPTFDQKAGPLHRLVQKFLAIFYVERKLAMRRAGIPLERNSGKKLLDIGCGAGDFLKHMEPYFAVSGQEPFSFNRDKHPALVDRIFQGRLAEAPFTAGSFHVVTFWQALEHMEEADQAIAYANKCLVPGGHLLISIPNIESWQARLFRSRWFHLVVPRHVFHFSRKTLSALVEKHGFCVVNFHTLTMEYGLSGWVQSFLNGLFEKDLFYEWVKARGEFERAKGGGKGFKVAVSLVLALIFLPVFAFVETVAGCCGRGAIMNLVCVKPEKPPRAR